ncbi:hypothetical protein [Mycobacterium persicum]|nr:hypothetical protein [Mycobacterium persicum]
MQDATIVAAPNALVSHRLPRRVVSAAFVGRLLMAQGTHPPAAPGARR